MADYKLSYTANEIDEKLGRIEELTSRLDDLENNVVETFLGTTPYKTQQSGTIKLKSESECAYEAYTNTVAIFDPTYGAGNKISKIEKEDGKWKIQGDGTATAWYQMYVSITVNNLQVGEKYNFIFDASTVNNQVSGDTCITQGWWILYDANGNTVLTQESTVGAYKQIRSFTAPTTSLSLSWFVLNNHYFQDNPVAYASAIAYVDNIYINKAGTEELTNVFSKNGTFNGSEILEIPANVNITSTPIAEVYSIVEEEYLLKNEFFNIDLISVPDYTDMIPNSQDKDGSIFNGTGFMGEKAIQSNGGVGAAQNSYVTGFIPVKKGDIIRFYNFSSNALSAQIALYKKDKENSSGIGKVYDTIIAQPKYYGLMSLEGNTLIWDTSSIAYYLWGDFAWMRATFTSSNMIITINEELNYISKEQLTIKPTIKIPQSNIEGLEDGISGKPLVGKKVVCFGDSMFGMYRGEDSAPAMIAEYTGATVYNIGFGGCRMSVHPTTGYNAFSMWALAKAIAENDWTLQENEAPSGSSYFSEQLTLLKSIDFNDIDMIVIHYGTNDFAAGGGTTIDNEQNRIDYTTLCGALRYSIEKIFSAYPKLQVYVSLPVYRFWNDNDTITYAEDYVRYGHVLPDFVDALKNTAKEYNLPVIDGYHGMGINRYNASAYLLDGTHHNIYGRKIFGEYIGGALISRH